MSSSKGSFIYDPSSNTTSYVSSQGQSFQIYPAFDDSLAAFLNSNLSTSTTTSNHSQSVTMASQQSKPQPRLTATSFSELVATSLKRTNLNAINRNENNGVNTSIAQQNNIRPVGASQSSYILNTTSRSAGMPIASNIAIDMPAAEERSMPPTQAVKQNILPGAAANRASTRLPISKAGRRRKTPCVIPSVIKNPVSILQALLPPIIYCLSFFFFSTSNLVLLLGRPRSPLHRSSRQHEARSQCFNHSPQERSQSWHSPIYICSQCSNFG